MSKTTDNFVRVSISIDRDLLRRADDYALHNYLSRSGLVAVALSNYLNAQQMGRAMQEITALLSKLVQEGGTPDDFAKLEKIENLLEFMGGNKDE